MHTADRRIGMLMVGAAATALAAGFVAPAGAAETAATAPTSVGEVVVTAQRVEENLQSVPVAVTAYGADFLRESHIDSIGDIAERTPGFTATAYNPAEPVYSMRGIGSDIGISQNAGGDPSVDVFVDGIYIGRGGTADLDAYNLERVEVLRGPQGTLFGKNAVGGLVQYVTKKPGPQSAFDISGTYGNYNQALISAHGNAPITDKLFVSAGISYRRHDGFTFNETTGHRVNDEDVVSGVAAVRWVPTNNLEVILSGDITHQDQKGQPRHNQCDTSFQGGVHCVGVNPDPRTVDAHTDGYIRRDVESVRAEVNWTTPLGVVTSLTGYRDVRLDLQTPFFSNPINPPFQIESTETDTNYDRQFSQELRLAFDAFDGRLTGVAGAYFLTELNKRLEVLDQEFFPGATGVAAFPQDVTAHSYALFGQLNYRILPRVTLTAGLRQTWEDKDGEFGGYLVSAEPGNFPPPLSVPSYDVRAHKAWSALTPRFGIEWQVTDQAMLYFSAARGFKSGGYQGIAGNAAGAITPYDPEYAWSYEVGLKSQWLDNRVRVNLSAFKTDYTNLQVSQLVPLCCVVVTNAAAADIKGVEVEFVARPLPELQFDAAYAYLDATYTKFPSGAGGDYTGHTLLQSPKDKFNVGGQYTLVLSDYRVTARVDYSYTSQFFFTAANLPAESQPAYGLIDAHLSIQPPGAHWEVSVWAKNLTNELVRTSVTDFPIFAQTLYAYQPPRTYGVTVRFRM
jgi:iron complex outermembrane receptor protein